MGGLLEKAAEEGESRRKRGFVNHRVFRSKASLLEFIEKNRVHNNQPSEDKPCITYEAAVSWNNARGELMHRNADRNKHIRQRISGPILANDLARGRIISRVVGANLLDRHLAASERNRFAKPLP